MTGRWTPNLDAPNPSCMDYGPGWWAYNGDLIDDPRLPVQNVEPAESMCLASRADGKIIWTDAEARFCTLPRDHDGPWHVASGSRRVLAEWRDDWQETVYCALCDEPARVVVAWSGTGEPRQQAGCSEHQAEAFQVAGIILEHSDPERPAFGHWSVTYLPEG